MLPCSAQNHRIWYGGQSELSQKYCVRMLPRADWNSNGNQVLTPVSWSSSVAKVLSNHLRLKSRASLRCAVGAAACLERPHSADSFHVAAVRAAPQGEPLSAK